MHACMCAHPPPHTHTQAEGKPAGKRKKAQKKLEKRGQWGYDQHALYMSETS